MFRTLRIPNLSLHKFFFPSVQPIAIVKGIIGALDEQQSQTIMLPFYTNLVPYISLFPSFLKDLVLWVSDGKSPRFPTYILPQLGQANYAMSDFTKVSGRRVDETLDSTDKRD